MGLVLIGMIDGRKRGMHEGILGRSQISIVKLAPKKYTRGSIL